MYVDAGTVPAWLLFGWTAAVGAVVGSFLNVVIARVPAAESVVWPGSRCPRCRSPIRWFDNIPILSWLWLRARCRSCRTSIPARYPLVEALGAGAALVAFSRHGLSGGAAAEFAFAAALIALAFIDIDTWLLPNAITWPLIASGLALAWTGATPAASLRSAAYGAGLGFAAFATFSWIAEKVFRKEALGFGDVWLLSALGAWMGAAALLPIVLLASMQGAAVGVVLLALGRGEPGPESTRAAPGGGQTQAPREEPMRPPGAPAAQDDWVPPKHAVPFGPFLVAGALEWLWLGALLARAVPVLQLFR